ncbi:MAG: DUF4827 domain-containing protein [Duncaniella sp.]|nr:DUF4827 domain-containing protein [Duncaniella sp.]MDE6582580.1 DUF4827 domain-containing protein [Duncaniella sp.]
MKLRNIFMAILMLAAIVPAVTSCSDSKSYAELLTDENHRVNYFLSLHRVETEIPADNKFEVGPDAPYYKMDTEGNVYMQVLDPGSAEKPEANDRVYFRYLRYNLFSYEPGSDDNSPQGNANNMGYNPVFFLLDNVSIQQSTQYGTGIQVPMHYLGYNAKVNLVVKSQVGATSEIADVIPYLYTISYFKSQI